MKQHYVYFFLLFIKKSKFCKIITTSIIYKKIIYTARVCILTQQYLQLHILLLSQCKEKYDAYGVFLCGGDPAFTLVNNRDLYY